MKKLLLALGLFVCCQEFVSAQDQNFRFGVQVSPTWSWLNTSDKKLDGSGANLGLKLGMLGEFYFAPRYAIVTGLGFGFNQGGTIQNGYPQASLWKDADLSDEKYRVVGQDAELHYRLRYIEIPFGLKLRGGTGEDNPLKYYAEIPIFTLGFLTKALGDIRGTDDNTEDEDIRDDVKKISLSWGLGAGIEYEFASSTTAFAGFAFQQQFTDVTGTGRVQKTIGADLVDEKSKASIGLFSLRLGVFF
ncbi:MAG: PorT family protein [Saprospiraceae bacterium]|nr:PorT family protein [Saprospiraceae bacterium]